MLRSNLLFIKLAFLKYSRIDGAIFNLFFIAIQVLTLTYFAYPNPKSIHFITFLFSFILSGIGYREIFAQDWIDEKLAHYLAHNHLSRVFYIFVEMFVFLLCCSAPLLIIAFIFTANQPTLYGNFYQLLLAITFLTAGCVPIGAICSTMSLAIGRQSFLPFMLSIPFNIPIFLITSNLLDVQTQLQSHIAIASGLTLINWALALIICPFTLRLSIR